MFCLFPHACLPEQPEGSTGEHFGTWQAQARRRLSENLVSRLFGASAQLGGNSVEPLRFPLVIRRFLLVHGM